MATTSLAALGGWSLLSQGAEARCYRGTLCGQRCVAKERFAKRYRHPDLERRLSNQRLVREARCMARAAAAGVCTPCVFLVDRSSHRIFMEEVIGTTVKALLQSVGVEGESQLELGRAVGETIALLHDAGIVHGDLTTSNIMLRDGERRPVLIDFGLASQKASVEDKAVDLYVLQRAFASTHPKSEPIFAAVLEEYTRCSRQSKATIQRYAQVEQRGRKRMAFG